MLSVAWATLAGVGILLNRLVEYMLESSNAPESISTLLSQAALGVPIFLGVAIVLTGFADIFRLMKASLRDPKAPGEDSGNNER